MALSGWKQASLGDVLELLIDHRGKTPRKLGGDWTVSGIPAISAMHISDGRLDLGRRERYVSDEMFRKWMTQPVKAGDVLLTSEAPVGQVARVPDDRPLVLSQRLFALRAHEAVLDQRFLEHWLSSPAAQNQITQRSSGTTVTGIRQAELRQMLIQLPSLAEQRRIVEIVEDHLSRLDAAASYATGALARTKSLVRSVLLAAVPERGRPGWKLLSVGEAGAVDLGRQRHPDWHNGPNMRPYLRVANVFEDRIDTTDVMSMDFGDAFDRFRLHDGDVLLNEGQSPHLLGRPAIYRGEPPEVAFTNSILRFRANYDVLPEWALLVFRRHMHAGRFARESRITTNIAHLSAKRFKSIEFPLPSKDEQRRLVQAVNDRLDNVARLTSAADMCLRRSNGLRRAVLAAAFSGQLTSRKIDNELEGLASAI